MMRFAARASLIFFHEANFFSSLGVYEMCLLGAAPSWLSVEQNWWRKRPGDAETIERRLGQKLNHGLALISYFTRERIDIGRTISLYSLNAACWCGGAHIEKLSSRLACCQHSAPLRADWMTSVLSTRLGHTRVFLTLTTGTLRSACKILRKTGGSLVCHSSSWFSQQTRQILWKHN